jgi:flagellar protein FliO/FliZ
MLLVKSKESKSLGNKFLFKTGVYTLLVVSAFASFCANAETKSLSNPTSIVSIFLSLLLVVGVIFMLAFLMRRFNVTPGGTGQLKVVASIMAGTKERVMVIQVGDEQHLLGVTPQNINHLAKLDKPLEGSSTSTGQNFKDKLTQALAGKMQSANSANSANSVKSGSQYD